MSKKLIESIDNFLKEDTSMGHSHNIKAGDIFVSSRGYDSTYLEWYLVLAASNTQVKIVQIGSVTVPDPRSGGRAESPNVKAVKGSPFTRKIMLQGSRPAINMKDGYVANNWNEPPYNGKPVSKNTDY